MKLTRKKLYSVNAVIFLVLVLAGLAVSVIFLSVSQKRAAEDKTYLVTEKVGGDIAKSLDRINTLSKSAFLSERFLDLIDSYDENSPDEHAVLQEIDKHFFNIFSQEPDLIKYIVFFDKKARENLIDGNIFYYGPNYEIIEYNSLSLRESAYSQEESRNGRLYAHSLMFDETVNSQFVSFNRNVNDVRPQESYMQVVGLGCFFIEIRQFLEPLEYGNVLDGLTLKIVTDGPSSVPGLTNPTVDYKGYRVEYALPYFDWSVTGVYDYSYLWSDLKYSLFFLGAAFAALGVFFGALFLVMHRYSVRSLNFLFQTFSDMKTDKHYEPVAHSGNAEIDQVIDSFNDLMQSLKCLNEEIYRNENKMLALELEKKNFALKSLGSQINQHFLINVLSLMRSFINLGETEKTKECIMSLSEILRYSMSEEDTVTLKCEIEHVLKYMSIQKIWHPELDFYAECSAESEDIVLPKLFLQPIIENSIVHSAAGKPLKIKLTAKRIRTHAGILIADNGQGMSKKRLAEVNASLKSGNKIEKSSGHGLALNNVAKRAELIYGDRFRMRIFSRKNKGTAVYIGIRKGDSDV